MVTIEVDLSNYPDRFSPGSRNLIITKAVNYVYGRNGTGKSTVARAIRDQFGATHNVCIFQGFEGLVGENKRLDAISLGREMVDIQEQIDALDSQITDLRDEVEPREKRVNLYSEALKVKRACEKQNVAIEKIKSDAARRIKLKKQPQIAPPSYDKNGFGRDISDAKQLAESEVGNYVSLLLETPKPELPLKHFPQVDLPDYLEQINGILVDYVSPKESIPDLDGNQERQGFAKEGMRVHRHEAGVRCAFCGSEVLESRWALLKGYFDQSVEELDKRIDRGIALIEGELNKLNSVSVMIPELFYGHLAPQVRAIQELAERTVAEWQSFFALMLRSLEVKKRNLFTRMAELNVTPPDDFSKVKEGYQSLVGQHKGVTENLAKRQKEAERALRLHQVGKELEETKYNDALTRLGVYVETRNRASAKLKAQQGLLEELLATRKHLMLQTRDDERLANEINTLLKASGSASFSLKLIEADAEGQKGQYQVVGRNGAARPITELSQGEKNIVAFLYFVLALKADDDLRPKVIVFDDPMTSNDDAMQYLIISRLYELSDEKDKTVFGGSGNLMIILTHSCHFYLNLRKRVWSDASHYNNHGVFHFLTNGDSTTIRQIRKPDNDVRTSYDLLWEELIFLYDQDKPGLMVNSCRRICETFLKFNGIDASDFYGSNSVAQKLFNVNSHSIDDHEAELCGKTREEVKDLLLQLFQAQDAQNHFDVHWKEGTVD